MKTLHLKAMDENAVNEITKAAEILKNGGLVAIPTETVYGLAASAFNESAVANIFKAKGRPNDNPLIVHIAEITELEKIAKDITPIAKKCMDSFWPGPFTAVLPKTEVIPASVSGGLNTVAVRMPNNPVARAIIKKSGLPLAAPSANRSGSPSPSTANHVIDDLDGRIDAVVISENCEVGVESTVVTFATEPPRLLRPGAVTAEQLKELIPDLIIDPAVTAEPEKGVAVASPGMKYKHYAPKAEVIMAVGSINSFCEYCNTHKADFDFALCYDEDEKNLLIPHLSLGENENHEKQAELLFKYLRDIDKKGYKRVIVHAPLKEGVGLAVYNRLIRAAGFKVIDL
ncbi:MAG: threonylcarbamoyl-AMP synthase [Clostridia bacterium]|nr:threonylcarbamoyl-AMP synthase [Clostridia bacterium]